MQARRTLRGVPFETTTSAQNVRYDARAIAVSPGEPRASGETSEALGGARAHVERSARERGGKIALNGRNGVKG